MDRSISTEDWASLEDVESLVAVVAAQLAGETGLMDWAEALVAEWLEDDSIASLMGAAGGG